MEETIKKLILCPINKKIMLEPVLGNDSKIYERSIINSCNATDVPSLKIFIDEYLSINPSQRVLQYSKNPKSYLNNVEVIHEIIRTKRYNELVNYTDFYLDTILVTFPDFMEHVFSKDFSAIHLHLFKNIIDKCTKHKNGSTIIHFVCQRSKNEDILMILDSDITSVNEDKKSPLMYLCDNDINMEVILACIKKGVNFNQKSIYGRLPLHYYCQNERINEMVFKLVLSCTDKSMINDLDTHGQSAWAYLCYNPSVSVGALEFAISKGANFSTKDIRLRTPLHLLCTNKKINYEIFKVVFDNTDKSLINDIDEYSHNPWMNLSITVMNLDIINYAISNGANFNKKSKDGRLPLHNFCYNGNISYEILKSVLSCTDKSLINDVDNCMNTPWHYLCQSPCTKEMIEYVISKGADFNLRNRNNWLPIHYTFRGSDIGRDVLEYLSTQSTKFDFKHDIGSCLSNKTINLVNMMYFIKKEATLNLEYNEKSMISNIIKRFSNYKLIKMLINRSNPDRKFKYGQQLIHVFCKRNKLEYLKHLISTYNCDLESKYKGFTPLYYACRSGDDELILYLIELGALISIDHIKVLIERNKINKDKTEIITKLVKIYSEKN